MKPIAKIFTDFPEKFGIPRQSGIVEELEGKIVFEKEFRFPEAVRGLEEFSHLWLIWEFCANEEKKFSPTVRPPRLGGNKRVGVFASRSPFRPNRLGLSCVKIDRIDFESENAPIIFVKGADLMNGTPIFDIKPYVQADCHPEALFGFTDKVEFPTLKVKISEEQCKTAGEKSDALIKVLEQKPVPAFHSDPNRVYGMSFAELEIKFKVSEKELTVLSIKNTVT